MLLRAVFDMIFPRFCPMCGARLTLGEEGICSPCVLHLPRTDYYKNPTENTLAKMLWGHFNVERAVAYIFYRKDSDVARAVQAMKYRANTDLCFHLARLMAQEITSDGEGEYGFFDGIDLIVPVPTSRNRRRERGYNQSEVLAYGISSITHIPVEREALIRTRFQGSQTRLSRRGRLENVEGSIMLSENNKTRERLKNRHVLIVDDVFTTGATVIACASAMEHIEGIKISVLTLCHATTKPKEE